MRRTAATRLLIAVACLLFITGLIPTLIPAAAAQGDSPADAFPRVLLLNSYHTGFAWSDEEMRGVLAALPGEVEVVVEYMDSKRHFDETYRALYDDIFHQKYDNSSFDCIITLDNNAFDFMLAHRQEMFPGTPIVFGGLNNFDAASLEGTTDITGVIETIDVAGTVAIALALQPDTRQILVISDHSTSGLVNRASLEALAAQGEIGAELVFLDEGEGLTIDELVALVREAPPQSIVYFADFFQDREGVFIRHEDLLPMLSAASPVPIYVHNETYFYGTIGGRVVSGYHHGLAIGERVLRILAGEAAGSIPIEPGPTTPMFDAEQLARWGIPLSGLPADSLVLNAPSSINEQPAGLIAGLAVFVIGLSALVLYLLANIDRRRRVEQTLRQSEARYRQLVELAPVPILVHADERVVFVNPAALHTLGGVSPEDLVGRSIWDIVHPDDRAAIQPRVKATYQSRNSQPGRLEVRFIRHDGRTITVETVAASTEFWGRPAALVMFVDVTERQQATLAQQQHAEHLQILLDVDRAILAMQSSEETVQVTLRRIRDVVPCLGAGIVRIDVEAGEAVLAAMDITGDTGLAIGTRFPVQTFVPEMFELLDQGDYYLIEDLFVFRDLLPITEALGTKDIRTALILPLIFQQELLGLLALGAADASAFNQEQIQIAREVADKLAIATQQARLLEAEQEQRILAEALRDTAAALNSTLGLDRVLSGILDYLGRVVPHSAATIMLNEAGTARIVGRRGYAERGLEKALLSMRYPIAETPNLQTMFTNKTILILQNVQDYPGWVVSASSRWIRAYLGSPIILEEEVLGFLNLDSEIPGFFTPDHAERLQIFASQAAVAIRNAQLYEAEQKRRHVAETLRRATAVLNTTLELDRVLDLILYQLRDVIAFDTASILRLERDGQLVILANYGFPEPEKVNGLRFPVVPKFPNMRVVREKTPLALDDVKVSYPHFHEEATTWESGNIRSWLGVPLLIKEALIGMITLDRASVAPYTEEDIELATAFANQAAIAIENASLHQSTRERATRLELVARVGRRTTAILDLDELLREAVHLISDAFGYFFTNILLVEGSDLVLRAATLPDLQDQLGKVRLRVGEEGITGWVAASGQPVIVPDVRLDPRYMANSPTEAATRSELAVPIRQRDDILGVLNVESDQVNDFSEADVSMIQTIADQLAVAINNAQLYTQVQRHAAELEERVNERTAELHAANQRLQGLSQIKDEFVSNVSHELRTPISNLKLYHKLLDLKPERSETYLITLQRETRRLEDLIEGLLMLSRLDQERVQLTLAPVDLNALAQAYVTDRAPLADSRELKLSFQPTPDLPPARADEKLIGQVLSVLLTNAFNYTPGGGAVIVSTLVADAAADGTPKQVGLSVVDNGLGIPQEEHSRMFERFFRGKAGRDSNISGTGLGLAIAREIVDRHGGRIEVESSGVPGSGAAFTVWLPAISPEKRAA